jgi:phage repressor protein C with HTH and peptisase S24 domain
MIFAHNPSMSEKLKKRLKSLMDERGLKPKPLSKAAGLNDNAVNDIFRKTGNASLKTLLALADTLGVSIATLCGEDDLAQTIKITGLVSAGESWTPIDDGGQADVRMAVDGDAVALEVRGDSMRPVYRPGDVLVGMKYLGSRIVGLVGNDCIITTDRGDRFVKYLLKSPSRGLYTLRSYNIEHSDIESVRVAWAAPIVWVRRSLKR